MKLILARNSISISVTIFIQDPDSPSGEGKTDLTYADINAAYYKSGSSSYEIMTLRSTTLGDWISGGFVELENYNPDPSGGEYMKGVYQLCLPDDVLADDSSTIADNSVVVMLTSGSTDIVPCILEIQLIEQDLGDANVVKWNSSDVDSDVPGIPKTDVWYVNGTPAAVGVPEVNTVQWNGGSVEAGLTGVPRVDIAYIDGVGVGSGGKIDSNVVEWNGIPLTDHDFIGVEANVINWNYDDEPVLDFGATMNTAVRALAVAGTLSSTQMTTNLNSNVVDFYKGRVIIWTTGVLENVARTITAYDGINMFTYAVLPGGLSPSAGDEFVIV